MFNLADPQFEDFIKKLAEGADKINAPQGWIGGEVIAGGRGNTYLFGVLFDGLESHSKHTLLVVVADFLCLLSLRDRAHCHS